MRRVSPISSIINDNLTYADTDLDEMYEYMQKLEESVHVAYETLREIDTYWTLPHVSDAGTWTDGQTEREKYLRRVMSEMRQRAANTMKLLDEIISMESRMDQ